MGFSAHVVQRPYLSFTTFNYYSFLAGLDPTEDERLLSFSGSMPSSALSRAPGDHDHLTAFDDENFDLDGRPIARYTISAA